MPTPIQNKDLYKILDLPRNATEDEIRVAYKKMALKWHPDRHIADKEDANQKFIEIHGAYKALMGRRERRSTRPTSSPTSSTSFAASYPDSDSDSHAPPSSPKPRNSTPVSEPRSRNAAYHFPGPHPNRKTPERRNSPYMSSPKGSGSTFKARRTSRPHKPAPSGQESSTEPSSSCPSSPSSSSSYFQADSSDSHTTPPTSPKFGHSVPLGHFEPQRSDASKSPKSTRAKLRKQSKPRQEQKHSPKRPKSDRTYAQEMSSTESDGDFVYVATPSEWSRTTRNTKDTVSKFVIKFTLEELFHGTRHRYLLERHFLSGKRKNIVFHVDIPPGCRPGSKVLFRGAGNERKDGTLQDVVFVIEEIPHQWFRRMKDDLVMDVKVPWSRAMEDGKAEMTFQGLDGQTFDIMVDYATDKTVNGNYVVPDAGMPIRRRGRIVGRGDLIVRWEVATSPTSKWETLKKVLHL